MPSSRQSHQSEFSYTEPAWIKIIRVAIVIMSTLIVVGLGLLIYGFSTRVGQLDSTPEKQVTIQFPAPMSPSSTGYDTAGRLSIHFADKDGFGKIVTLTPDRTDIDSIITLVPWDNDGFAID